MTANAAVGVKGFVARPFADRFWEKVQKSDGCWLWLGARRSSDPARAYGMLWVDGRNRPAAQVAWELEHAQPFPQGMDALHHCDNPPCVRPSHIFPGTPSDNAIDMQRKGRHPNRFPMKLVCKYGHPFTPENIHYRPNGWRVCRACRSARGPHG